MFSNNIDFHQKKSAYRQKKFAWEGLTVVY
jgi:hypothetical protein